MDIGRKLESVLEDTRERNRELVELIKFTDAQALSLLQLYITVSLAAAAGSIAAMTSPHMLVQAAAWGGFASIVPLVIGCFFCLRATRVDLLYLPGRGAEFWQWASHRSLTQRVVIAEYLKSQIETQQHNRSINAMTAGSLKRAKYGGIAAAATGLGVAAAAFLVIWFLEGAGEGSHVVLGPRSSDCPSQLAEAVVDDPCRYSSSSALLCSSQAQVLCGVKPLDTKMEMLQLRLSFAGK